MQKKTVFIVVTRGFIVRNILRTGVLSKIRAKGVRIVIMLATMGRELPHELQSEFERFEGVEVIGVPDVRLGSWRGKVHRVFIFFASRFLYSGSSRNYILIGNSRKLKRSAAAAYLDTALYFILGHIPGRKRIARWMEQNVFTGHTYADLFEKYRPQLVFSTSIYSKVDIEFMKEARERGIATVSMPKGWDNVTKHIYRFVPDRIITQNEAMKRDMVRYQDVPAERIVVTGFPRFDWYRQPEMLLSREETFRRLGLDPQRRLLFFGSEGVWAPNDHMVAVAIAKHIQKDGFAKACCLLARPHFTDVASPRFTEALSGYSHVKVDDNFTRSEFFLDNWDPSVEESRLFVSAVHHCDVMITVASTLALDAACADKPVVLAGYNVLYNDTGTDLSKHLYESDHYRQVTATGAVTVAKNDSELFAAIDSALREPARQAAEREVLRGALCYRVDGHASERVADAVLELLP